MMFSAHIHSFKSENTFDLEAAKKAFTALKEQKLVSINSELIDFDFHQYSTFYRSEEMVNKLNTIKHPSFYHLDSRALINSLTEKERWDKKSYL